MLNRRQFVTSAALAGLATRAPLARAATGARAFPRGFLWGASTAAYQVEGNNVGSDIWAAEHAANTPYAEPSGDAANSFALWPTDLDLVRGLGLNTYRFSLEWARIEPEPGQFSIAMLDHYKAMIAGCHARGITPVVTFNHFSTPLWFALKGGWAHPDSPELFARFCDRAARHLADGIGFATTLNEPNLAGMLVDVLPPELGARLVEQDKAMSATIARAHNSPQFLAGNSIWVPDPAVGQAHMLRAHALARAAIKAVRGDLPVGVSLAIVDDQATGSPALRDAAREKLYAPWLRAARGDDFVGVQNYTRQLWGPQGRLPVPPGAPRNDGGEEIYAPSLAGAVRYAHDVARVPILVTEHGLRSDDDAPRQKFIPAALAALHEVIAQGVPVLGYCHWSLIDNYEWGFGYAPKFGLHSLDRRSFVRTAKPSAAIYGAIARANAV
ncbi:glycoside hydrolase family 1 protein [Novosphingobium sp.]|uniref:glycoside hydrolase family 1 protein n=1 Tax=Novosphingobium sp. TaxID=1874826 RepID=UPI003D0BEC20